MIGRVMTRPRCRLLELVGLVSLFLGLVSAGLGARLRCRTHACDAVATVGFARCFNRCFPVTIRPSERSDRLVDLLGGHFYSAVATDYFCYRPARLAVLGVWYPLVA